MHEIKDNYLTRFEEIKDIIHQQTVEFRESNHRLANNMQTMFNELQLKIEVISAKINKQ